MSSNSSGPGAIRVRPGTVTINADRTDAERLTLVIVNTGDRPVQIGSHLHLPDEQHGAGLRPRRGARLPARHPSGTSVRFEPGRRREVAAVALRGRRRVPGHPGQRSRGDGSSMADLDRERYAALYGPTTGDQVRLGDTDLWIEVEEDLTFGGEEAVFGGGKSIRESMAQGTRTRADGALDTVITNAVVLDHWGVVRADVGIRDGRIVALGRSGNPDIADGVHPDLEIGPGTDVISGEGRILTAGGVDLHVHFLSRSQVHEALATGHHHPRRRRHRTVRGLEGDDRHARARGTSQAVHRALDPLPGQRAADGQGQHRQSAAALAEQALAGAAAYKVHEDWGSTPAAIDAALRAADEFGLQVALHSDSLNEAGYRRVDAAARSAGARIHAFHAEGAGGGHAPDIVTRGRRSRT